MRFVIRLEMTITVDVVDDVEQASDPVDNRSIAECIHCGWRGIYSRPPNAQKALAAHLRHCRKAAQAVKQAFDQVVAG
jgi:hypothetical protein